MTTTDRSAAGAAAARALRPVALLIALPMLTGCASGAPAASTQPASALAPSAPVNASAPPSTSSPVFASPSLSATDLWEDDLAYLDQQVRSHHPDPFAIHPESEWTANLAELRTTLPGATPDEQLVQLSRLIGLLDQHSSSGPSGPMHAYEALFYKFRDGWFTIAAKDPSLVGTKLVGIEGTPVDQVEAALRPLVPDDNESGFLDSVQGLFSFGEYLHGLGIVADPLSATYTLERPDGTAVDATLHAVDSSTWERELGIVGGLVGAAPEAVARRTESAWWRIDEKRDTFLLSYNDYTEVVGMAIFDLRSALDGGTVDRVVADLRYLRGGNGSLAQPLIDELTTNVRLQKPGALTVLIGRENVSAGTVVDGAIDRGSAATLVGEESPARADNFLCECFDFPLRHHPFAVGVPTVSLHNGDTRGSIPPDVPMALSSVDFFAGKDPVLDAAMAGTLP